MDRERVILHIDMDAFFASVEQKTRPGLLDKPVAVIGSGSRTVVTTASYQARRYGVKTGMTIYEARRLCPHIRLVIGNNRKYIDTSCRILKIFQGFTPLVEAYSIDEAFMDITGSVPLFESPEAIAGQIKVCIKKDLGLTCSIGIAPNKLLAKLGSDIDKPDGFFRIRPDEISRFMEELPVGELCGIGRRMANSLAHLGIVTCGQLGRMPEAILTKRYGVIGERLKAMGQGRDDTPVVPIGQEEEVKSVGHSMTLQQDIGEQEDILRYLLILSQMVGARARSHHLAGRTIALTIRYADFTTFTTRKTVTRAINSTLEIWRVACDIISGICLVQPVRLLGVSLSNLSHQARQLSLSGWASRHERACKVMDEINQRFGENCITWGAILSNPAYGSKVISPGWRPEGARRVEAR